MFQSIKRRTLTAVLVLGAAVVVGNTASAQQPVRGVLEACEGDIAKYCEGVTPGNGRILACMYAYEDQITEACAVAIVDFADVLDDLFYSAGQALAICAPDIEKHCAGTEIGGGRLLSCLNDKAIDVSAECKSVTAQFSEALAGE